MILKFTQNARKNLDKLSDDIVRRVSVKLKMLEQNPYMGKRLTGELSGSNSIRIWPYRAIYWIDEKNKTIWIEKIEHRKDVYR